MPATTITAPGKIILFGEHAVVYGRPAIAIPVHNVQARATVIAEPRLSGGTIHIQAPDISIESDLVNMPHEHPLAMAVYGVLNFLSISQPPAFTLRISSTIPLAAGLGSGAAVTTVIVRAVAAFMGKGISDKDVSTIVFDVEKHYHGTPSGIDNTVIAYQMPVFFKRGQPVETLPVKNPFWIVIGDTGIKSPTALAVADLRRLWQSNPTRFEQLFDEVGNIANKARGLIEGGRIEELGPLMDANHALLQTMTVSSPELDNLVAAARAGGALGAKLSGGGRGGNMIALTRPENTSMIVEALHEAGAVRTIVTEIRDRN